MVTVWVVTNGVRHHFVCGVLGNGMYLLLTCSCDHSIGNGNSLPNEALLVTTWGWLSWRHEFVEGYLEHPVWPSTRGCQPEWHPKYLNKISCTLNRTPTLPKLPLTNQLTNCLNASKQASMARLLSKGRIPSLRRRAGRGTAGRCIATTVGVAGYSPLWMAPIKSNVIGILKNVGDVPVIVIPAITLTSNGSKPRRSRVRLLDWTAATASAMSWGSGSTTSLCRLSSWTRRR